MEQTVLWLTQEPDHLPHLHTKHTQLAGADILFQNGGNKEDIFSTTIVEGDIKATCLAKESMHNILALV